MHSAALRHGQRDDPSCVNGQVVPRAMLILLTSSFAPWLCDYTVPKEDCSPPAMERLSSPLVKGGIARRSRVYPVCVGVHVTGGGNSRLLSPSPGQTAARWRVLFACWSLLLLESFCFEKSQHGRPGLAPTLLFHDVGLNNGWSLDKSFPAA
jgi:hypothetical protein